MSKYKKKSNFEKKKRASTWDDKNDSATSSDDDDDDMEFKELANLYLMANNNITKEEICMMANKNINIDEANEFEPQITFDDL